MPNHVHVLEPGRADPGLLRWRLECALRPLGDWESPPTPSDIPDDQHMARQARYVALNPCRKGLCDDPLSWEWSTYLDSQGFIADPWVPWNRIASWARTPARWHAYVSSDPSARTGGSPAPGDLRAHTRLRIGDRVPLDWLSRGALLATRSGPDELRRHKSKARGLFLQLASSASTHELRPLLGPISPQALWARRRERPSPAEQAAVQKILGDRRTLELALRIP